MRVARWLLLANYMGFRLELGQHLVQLSHKWCYLLLIAPENAFGTKVLTVMLWNDWRMASVA